LREAEAELAAARDLFAGGHWSWCCFTCQQSAEKAIKALGEHFQAQELGHNLNLLLQGLETRVDFPQAVRAGCARLNRYYIPARNPDAFPQGAPTDQYFDADARGALADAEDVYAFAKGIIGPP
jgi:HEPN domain-containing protein